MVLHNTHRLGFLENAHISIMSVSFCYNLFVIYMMSMSFWNWYCENWYTIALNMYYEPKWVFNIYEFELATVKMKENELTKMFEREYFQTTCKIVYNLYKEPRQSEHIWRSGKTDVVHEYESSGDGVCWGLGEGSHSPVLPVTLPVNFHQV